MNCQISAMLPSCYLLGGRINWLIQFFPKKAFKSRNIWYVHQSLFGLSSVVRQITNPVPFLLPREVTVNGSLGLRKSSLTGRKMAVKLTDTLCFLFSAAKKYIHTHCHLMAIGSHMIYRRHRDSGSQNIFKCGIKETQNISICLNLKYVKSQLKKLRLQPHENLKELQKLSNVNQSETKPGAECRYQKFGVNSSGQLPVQLD